MAGLLVALVAGISAIVTGRQSSARKSRVPAAAVALAVVLLLAYAGTMAYVFSTLDNFGDQ